MLYTIAVVLLVLWLLGLVSGYTLGAFVHILLGDCGRLVPGRIRERPPRRVTASRALTAAASASGDAK